jgi:hypothetical protein
MTNRYKNESYSSRLEMALHELLIMLDNGREYPDAQFACTQKFNVKANDLQNEYDNLG